MNPEKVHTSIANKKEFDLRNAFGPIPESFTRALQDVLKRIGCEDIGPDGQYDETECANKTSANRE